MSRRAIWNVDEYFSAVYDLETFLGITKNIRCRLFFVGLATRCENCKSVKRLEGN